MTLTLRQRVLGIKVAGAQTGDLKTRELWDDIQKKLSLTEAEQKEAFNFLPNGQVQIDLAVFDGPRVNINLEKQERRFLLDGLNSFKNYEQGDPVWARKLIKELEDSLDDTPKPREA